MFYNIQNGLYKINKIIANIGISFVHLEKLSISRTREAIVYQ